jgi:NADPH oxidase
LNNVAQLSAKNGQGFTGFLRAGFLTGPTWTGWIMLIALMLMVGTSVEKPRRANFERFWYTHHLFVVFFIFWSMHGIWCMIPADFAPFCSGTGVFYEYWIYGAVIYLAERVAREIRGRHATVISKVIQHPSNVVEIQIKKEKTITKAGQVSISVSEEVPDIDMMKIVHLPLLPGSISLAIPPLHTHQCP